MKKFILLSLASFCLGMAAHAQTGSLQRLQGSDTTKLAPLAPWSYKNIKPLSPLFSPENIMPDSLVKEMLEPNGLSTLDNMPVVKLNSADRMPVLKLGDTETTHFTMLIKPLGTIKKLNPLTP